MAGSKQNFTPKSVIKMAHLKGKAYRSPQNEQKHLRKRGNLKKGLEAGIYTDFEQLLSNYPKVYFAEDATISISALYARLADPGKFNLHEIKRLSDAFELDPTILLYFILAQLKPSSNER